MSLRFRRNLPLLLLLVTIIAVLVLGLGNQPIVAYTVGADGVSGSPSRNDVDLIDGVARFFGLSWTTGAALVVPASGGDALPAADDDTIAR